MISSIDSTEKTNKLRSFTKVTKEVLVNEVKEDSRVKAKGKIKPGVYISVEGGRLIPCAGQDETPISSIIAASISKGVSHNITPTLYPSSVGKTLIIKKEPSVKVRNVSVKRRHTEDNGNSVLQSIHKPGTEITEKRKHLKIESSTRDSHSNSEHNNFQRSNLRFKSHYNFNCKDPYTVIDKNVSSVPEHVYETLEDMNEGNCDHDYGQHKSPKIQERVHENRTVPNLSEELTEDQARHNFLQEDFQKGYEEVMVNETTLRLSQYITHEADVELVENRAVDSSSLEIPPSQTKLHAPVKASLQRNNLESINTKKKNFNVRDPCTSKSAVGDCSFAEWKVLGGNAQSKRPRVNDKFPKVPVPAHINQYGDCLKTRLGRHHYGLTLNDPPSQFFQGVLKGASGQTLAVMFGDIDLVTKFQSVSLDEIGHFVIDTTFRVSPNGTEGVNQMFTISLLYQNVVIPMWYAVTSCSSPELYKRILIEFQQHVLDWPFTSVLLNNDPALCKAVRAVFPDIDIYGSWFHYCYSIWKEVNIQNLTEQCKAQNSTLLTAVKLLMVVPYLPSTSTSTNMADGFEYVKEFARRNNFPNGFNKVLNYISDFWFNKVKPENFTLFGKQVSALNHVEAIQLLFLSFMKQNGNVWILTRSFQSIARAAHTNVLRFLNGKRLTIKKSHKGKKFNAPIRLNMKKLMAGTLDVKTFLEKSTVYLEEILDIFLHPLYPTTTFEKTNYIHSEGWAVRIYSAQ